jgi:predicted  nucleic acid-binding Zn-ribbon protein
MAQITQLENQTIAPSQSQTVGQPAEIATLRAQLEEANKQAAAARATQAAEIEDLKNRLKAANKRAEDAETTLADSFDGSRFLTSRLRR